MFSKIKKTFNRIYLDKNYTFFKKNVILFYELGCFLQKKNYFFLADIFFSIPYNFYKLFTFKTPDFEETCFLYYSSKANIAKNYERYFNKLKKKKLKILEIGIGGHSHPHLGGSSLRALKRYFKNCIVLGIDLVDKNCHRRKKIKTLRGSQIDNKFLENTAKEYGPFDIIIDDGSHYVEHQLFSFKLLFKHLNINGIYIIEDVHTSYKKSFGGNTNISDENHLVNFFSNLAHNVYLQFIMPDEQKKLKTSINISSIQFFSDRQNSILIEKSDVKKSSYKNYFNFTKEELKKNNPDNKYNIKSTTGVREYPEN